VGRELYVALPYYPDEPSGWEQVHVVRFTCAAGTLDLCAPQDAAVPDPCGEPASLGWRWTGAACVELIGCEGDCVGADCGRLARNERDCLSDRQLCP
jgi:hypothetical protein